MYLKELDVEVKVNPTFELANNMQFANHIIIRSPKYEVSFMVLYVRDLYASEVFMAERNMQMFKQIFGSETKFIAIVNTIIKMDKLDSKERVSVWKN